MYNNCNQATTGETPMIEHDEEFKKYAKAHSIVDIPITKENSHEMAYYYVGRAESYRSVVKIYEMAIVFLLVVIAVLAGMNILNGSNIGYLKDKINLKDMEIKELTGKNSELTELLDIYLNKVNKTSSYIQKNSKLTQAQASKLAVTAWREASKAGIDFTLVLAIIEKESTFNTKAVNPISKASGSMQVICSWHCSKYNIKREDLLRTDIGVKVGVSVLNEYISLYGGVNNGVKRYYGHLNDEENSKYLRDVLRYQNKIKKYLQTA